MSKWVLIYFIPDAEGYDSQETVGVFDDLLDFSSILQDRVDHWEHLNDCTWYAKDKNHGEWYMSLTAYGFWTRPTIATWKF